MGTGGPGPMEMSVEGHPAEAHVRGRLPRGVASYPGLAGRWGPSAVIEGRGPGQNSEQYNTEGTR